MAIRGSLGVSSVADVLQLLALGRKSGRLLIYSPGRLVLVELEEGAIVHATRPGQGAYVCELVQRRGIAPAHAPGDGGAEDGLVQRLIERFPGASAEIRALLREVVEETVCGLFTWDEGEFEFEHEAGVGGRKPGISFPVDHLLLEAARRADERAEIERTVRIGEVAVLTRPFAELAAAAVSPEERRLLAACDGRRTVAAIIRETGLLEFAALRLLADSAKAGAVRFEARADERTLEGEEEVRHDVAHALTRLGRHELAHREWSHLLERDPRASAARFGRATAALRFGRHREATRDLMRYIEECGPTAPALQNLILALEAGGRLEEARLTAEEAAFTHPADEPLALTQAVVRTKTGDLAGACEAFDRFAALRTTRGAPVAYYLYAVLAYGACGQIGRAEALAGEGIGLHPASAALLTHAGLIAERSGQDALAEERYRAALEVEPGLAPARRCLADLLYSRGDLTGAAREYEALPPSARGAEAEFRIGEAFFAVGDAEEAERRWRAALAVDAGHLAARRALRRLRAAAAEPR